MIYGEELKKTIEAAEAAGNIQLDYKTKAKNIEIKNDSSPVTHVDKLCEIRIREILAKAFPQDGFLGEETGSDKGKSGRRWIVDPIDGTRPYIRGIPTHSVLIALEDNEDLVVGCIFLPSLKEIYWAQKGAGAFLNNEAIHVSSTLSLEQCFGTALGFIDKQGTKDADKTLSLMKKWDYSYGFMDAYSYGCIAAGRIDVSVNLLDKPWDCAAAACIVREAGGRFSDIYGKETIYSESIVLSNGFVHNAVLEYFNEPG